MKKSELIVKIAKNSGFSQKDVEVVFDATCEAIMNAVVVDAEDVPFGIIGKFKKKNNLARVGHNPLTGESLNIPASSTIAFKASSKMRVVKEEPKTVVKKKAKK